MALQEVEPQLRTLSGYRHLIELRELREAMKDLNFKEIIIKVARKHCSISTDHGTLPEAKTASFEYFQGFYNRQHCRVKSKVQFIA